MKKSSLVTSLSYLVAIGLSLYLAWFSFFTYAVWVLPPRGKTREESIELLDKLIARIAQDLALPLLIGLSILLLLSWLILRKFRIPHIKRHLGIQAILAMLIICYGLFLGMEDAKEGLTIEIDRHFVRH
ncbi:MAG: hypothetical protein EP332_09720 [Bacteroidetes bacterium]|nr:MAG: hypothetical protein EP332_09720 [Bacteroidota bacterium]